MNICIGMGKGRNGGSRCPVIVGVLISLLIFAAFAEASDGKRLLFLGNRNIAPVVYMDGGVPSGVAVDIVRALAKHMPQPVEIRAMDWLEAQALVAEGKADALIQINRTAEREKLYEFSDSLLESQFSIFTTTDRVGISGASSLRGLRVGVEAGGLPRQVLEKDSSIQLSIIPNFLEGFKQLNDRRVDAVVVDYRVGSYVIAENRLRHIKVSGKPIAFSSSSIAVKKGNAELLTAINHGLSTMKADGTYAEIMEKWEPKEVIFKTKKQIAQITYSAVVAVLLVLLVIAAGWTLTLKRELGRRKAAEEKLKGEEVRYRALFENSPISLFEEDFSEVKRYIDGLRASGIEDFRSYFQLHPEEVERCARSTRIIAVNQATLKLFMAQSNEHLLAGLNSIFCRESLEIFAEELITLAGGGTQFENEAVQIDLQGRPFETIVRVSVAPGYEESWERVFVSINDITDRKRAEDALRASEARFRRMADNARDVIYRMSLPEGSYQYISPAAMDLFGYAPDEFYASPNLVRKIIHPEWHSYFEEEWSKLLRGEMPPTYEFQIVRKSGEVRWVNQRNILVRDDDGRIVAIEGIATDVTERKNSEEQLRTLNEELEQRVKDRTAELEAKYVEVERINRLFVGRELRMVELKERIKELQKSNGYSDATEHSG